MTQLTEGPAERGLGGEGFQGWHRWPGPKPRKNRRRITVRGEGDGSWLQEEQQFLPSPFCMRLWGLPGGIQTHPGAPHRCWEMGTWSAGLGRAVGRRQPECHLKGHSGKVPWDGCSPVLSPPGTGKETQERTSADGGLGVSGQVRSDPVQGPGLLCN